MLPWQLTVYLSSEVHLVVVRRFLPFFWAGPLNTSRRDQAAPTLLSETVGCLPKSKLLAL